MATNPTLKSTLCGQVSQCLAVLGIITVLPLIVCDYYSASVGQRSIAVSLSVCLSVSPRAYLWNCWTNLHEILCADALWPWLCPLTALRYVIYFCFVADVTFGHNGPYGD